MTDLLKRETSALPTIGEYRIEAVTADGAYCRLRITCPALAETAAAGQFLAVLIADGLGMPLRRYFSIIRASPASVEFVFSVHSPGTRWLSERRPGDHLNVFGPLGRPFPPVTAGCELVLMAGSHGAAALIDVAVDSVRRGAAVKVILGAPTANRVFGVAEYERTGAKVEVCTEDGSQGYRGRITELAERALQRGCDAVYACGPMPMLAIVARLSSQHKTDCWVATEVPMACAVGVCMTCVLPLRDLDGTTRMSRVCREGPVLQADRVRWDHLNRIPADCVGAP
jgi:dihydroorotate dehydrogenase electron transfer subunit